MSTFHNLKKNIIIGYLIQVRKIIRHILRWEGDCTAYKWLILTRDKFTLVCQMYINISVKFTMNEILEFNLQE